MTYEELRERHLVRLAELLPDFVGRLTWSREQLRGERAARLREVVAVAKARSPWRRARLAPLDADRLDADDLRALPVMTKDDLMAHFDEIVTDRPAPSLHSVTRG